MVGSVDKGSLFQSFSKATDGINKSLRRLSSGRKSALELGAAESIRAALEADSAALGQASRNISDTSSALQIADGALESQSGILQRMSELATQASNGTLNQQQKDTLQVEFQSLQEEYGRISQTTQFNGQNLIDNGSLTTQADTGSDANSQITSEEISSVDVSSLNISSDPGTAIDSLKGAIGELSSQRGSIGAVQSRLNAAQSNVEERRIAQTQAASVIADIDVAEETANLTRNNILRDAGAAVLAQANLSERTVLKLLGRGTAA